MNWREPYEYEFELDEQYLCKEGGEAFVAVSRDGYWTDRCNEHCDPEEVLFSGSVPWVIP